MIPEPIDQLLTIAASLFFSAVFLALIWLFARQMVRLIARDTTWRRQPEPETYGDDGGHPALYGTSLNKPDTPAPETGSGLRAGASRWPAISAEDAECV